MRKAGRFEANQVFHSFTVGIQVATAMGESSYGDDTHELFASVHSTLIFCILFHDGLCFVAMIKESIRLFDG